MMTANGHADVMSKETEAVTLRIDEDGIAWLIFDVPDGRVNTLSSASMAAIAGALDEVEAHDDIRALVIRSGKPDSFIVGADLEELKQLEGEDAARGKAEEGQQLFQRIADLPCRTIAAIHGACLGGGMELSLACDHRVCTDDDKTSLGLPEVNLGILPGWGGTQRLPRLIGLPQALTLILTGKPSNARKARRLGLVDTTVASAFLEEQTRVFVERVLTPSGLAGVEAKRRKRQSKLMRLLLTLPPMRAFVFRRATKDVMSKTKGQYPAPLEAIQVIRKTYGKPIERGLPIEAAALGRLAATETSKNLVRLFQASQRLKKTAGEDAREVTHAGVVGAGIMGGGIAWALSNAGVQVRLKDLQWDAVAKGLATASKYFGAKVKRRRMTPGAYNLAMHRISGTVDYTGFSRLDMVIEAVVENMDVKKAVLREIEEQVSRDTVICTNTSSLSLDEMASAMKHPERFVGLHFFNPVNRMQLVEVIAGEKTSPEAVEAAAAVVQRMGKIPVIVGACAGFLVNRILVPYMVESTLMFEEGVEAERLDAALERFGMPMGALALADEVGLDVGYKVAKVLEVAYGERMHVPDGFGRVVESGDLHGKKTGRGFYVYDNGHKKVNDDARKLALNGHADDAPSRLSDDDVVDRAILTMVNEAARCLEEGVATDPEDLDTAMVMGTGFAPFRGGVLRYAQDRGVKEVVARLNELSERYGDRFRPAPLLEKVASNGGRFYPEEN